MVVTFLVTPNFRQSAQHLDRMRLGKQRVEAMQILHCLVDLNYLSSYFNTTIPPRGASREEIYAWVDDVMSQYKALDEHFIYLPDSYEPLPVTKIKRYQRAKDNETYEIVDEESLVYLRTKSGLVRTVSIDEFLPPGWRVLGDGLRKHPVLTLWHTYIPALCEYINAHIEEWIDRGYKNNMVMYDINPDDLEYPPWVNNPEFHRRMKARLREKETQGIKDYTEGVRKTRVDIWYTAMDDFVNAGSDDGYLW